MTKQVEAGARAYARGDSYDEAVNGVNFMGALFEAWKMAAIPFAGRTYNGIEKAAKSFGPEQIADWEDAVDEYLLANGANKVKLISFTTREMIRKQVELGVAEGLGPRQVAKKILGVWNGVSINGETYGRNRAARIARTEILGASNYGNLIGADATGLQLRKVWLSARDKLVRSSHSRLDGTSAPKDGRFLNGLEYPGDPNGPAREIINCRCDMYFEVEE